MSALPIRVVALYRFTRVDDPATSCALLQASCRSTGIRGTILLAREGINATVAGSDAAVEEALAVLRSLPGCADLKLRESRTATMPFRRLKIDVRDEIVTMGLPDVDPLNGAGRYVEPEDWNALIDRPDTVVIDTRNDYEVAIGSFTGAIDPKTSRFRDFPAWFRSHRAALLADRPPPRVAMFCTGGIRCEKATAFLRAEGVTDVHHLKGGILAYLDRVAPSESRWNGDCFVFDERVSVRHGLNRGGYSLCPGCGIPVSDNGKAPTFDRSTPRCDKCRSPQPAMPAEQ